MFIVLEGGEATGKSTVAEIVKQKLHEHNVDKVKLTREPGGTEFSEEIREIIMKHPNIDPETETMLFNAARRANIKEVIKPALEAGYVVISDRFTDSTIVYQGMMKGHKISEVDMLNQIGSDGLVPDLTVVLDLPSEVAMERMEKRGQENRFDDMTLDEFDLIRTSFNNLGKSKWARNEHVIIDASKDVETVAEEVFNCIITKLF